MWEVKLTVEHAHYLFNIKTIIDALFHKFEINNIIICINYIWLPWLVWCDWAALNVIKLPVICYCIFVTKTTVAQLSDVAQRHLGCSIWFSQQIYHYMCLLVWCYFTNDVYILFLLYFFFTSRWDGRMVQKVITDSDTKIDMI